MIYKPKFVVEVRYKEDTQGSSYESEKAELFLGLAYRPVGLPFFDERGQLLQLITKIKGNEE